MRKTSFFTLLVGLLLFAACQNQNKKFNPADSNILKQRYWINQEFADALFADNVPDTLGYLVCSELLFLDSGRLILTYCLSDAGAGAYEPTGPNTMELTIEGYENKNFKAALDEKTGILTLDAPELNDGKPLTFRGYELNVGPDDYDGVIQLARKRIAGSYSIEAQEGMVAPTVMVQFEADGSLKGLGRFDYFEPWPSGIGGGAIPEKKNLMYLSATDSEEETAVAWQLRGDTLRLWETENLYPDEMPEYKIIKLMGIFVKR